MDPAIWVAVISSVAAIVASVFAWRGSTRAAEVGEQANQVAWVKELRQDAADARREASAARTEAVAARSEAVECRKQMETVRRDATALADELHRIVRAIHDPYMSIDRLRVMVPFPGTNGIST